ncbi:MULTISPECIES: AAA family ATPase [Actinomyces]|uniref:AAA+ ATPase domain-containing protein n=2 Tax=Actinomyces TaxID=1654 RepID=A0A1M4RZ38_9ACTO|nr:MULTISPECIES: AAA family ATPase [Actinomyces]CED92177.1 Toprim domain protein [Actinomyces succiniciruminis]SHE25202.1 Hypothetical protein ACGLYG10_1418 [Actinomyces glycerinitolerans]
MSDASPFNNDDGARQLRVTWVDTITPRAVRWAWEYEGDGRIPVGSLSLAAGREGTGKSSFGIWLAAQITRGTLPGAYRGQARRVLYVAVEDSWEYTLVPRLMAAGADLSKVGRVQVQEAFGEEVTMSLPRDNTALEEAIAANDVALVVVDPLMSLLGDGLSASRSREVRRMLDPLVRIADRTGSVVLGIAHHNKGAHTDPIMAVSESKAFTDVPRSVFAFARDDGNDCRVVSQTKNSLGRDAASLPSLQYTIEEATVPLPNGEEAHIGRFTPQGVSERSVTDLLRAKDDGEDADERSAAEAFIVDFIGSRGGEAGAGEVIKAGRAAGFSEQALKNARRRCKSPRITTRKASMGQGWVWAFESEGATKVLKVPCPEKTTPSAPSVTPSADEEETPPQPAEAGTCPHGAPEPDLCAECGGATGTALAGGDRP